MLKHCQTTTIKSTINLTKPTIITTNKNRLQIMTQDINLPSPHLPPLLCVAIRDQFSWKVQILIQIIIEELCSSIPLYTKAPIPCLNLMSKGTALRSWNVQYLCTDCYNEQLMCLSVEASMLLALWDSASLCTVLLRTVLIVMLLEVPCCRGSVLQENKYDIEARRKMIEQRKWKMI